MHCRKCPRYDAEAQHCLDGKANPRSKADTVSCAETLGLQSLCHYNPFRDSLAQLTYFPNADTSRRLTARRTARRGRGARITVEIEETTE